jgi:hypothetical protein
MRVGIVQSSYVPWRGYFDFIKSVDLFILFDDVQYTRRSWRSRNRVKTSQGLRWLTVPVSAQGLPAIDQVQIAPTKKSWRMTHRVLLTASLEPCPYFRDALELWCAGTPNDQESLSVLNARLIRGICEYLEIRTPIVNARDYGVSGAKTDRLIGLLKEVGATCYVSGPTARGYLDEESFRHHSIRLEYKSYDYAPYPQPWRPFEGGVTVLDLIANIGPDCTEYLRTRTPDIVAVS